MKILAVTCYTGGKELVDMTSSMLKQLRDCVPKGVDAAISVCAQGVDAALTVDPNHFLDYDSNVGFAFGMNSAIDNGLRWESEAPDFVLCLNNDLQFPQKDWLRNLLEIGVAPVDQVIVPATDSAAIRIQAGPRNKPSFPVDESSAYCWLVPFAWCQFLKDTYGFWLFDEDFAPAYGEDNWTAFLLSKQFGERVFRYVPRSFVKHLRARTSRTVKHDRAKSSRTLVAKLQAELKDPKLRVDLRAWAHRYIAILSKRS